MSAIPTMVSKLFIYFIGLFIFLDKYLLVELLCNTALTAQVNCLEFIGLNKSNIDTILKWGENRSGIST